MYISNAKLTNLEEISVSSFLFLHCLSDSLPPLRSQEALRLLPLRQTSAVFFMILRLAPHYGFCTSILNLGSAIYDFLKTPNKDNHNSQLSNVNFPFFYSTQAFIGQSKDYQSQVYRYYIEHLIQHIFHTKKTLQSGIRQGPPRQEKQQVVRKGTKWNDDNPPEATKFATKIKKSAHNGTAFKNIHYICIVVPRRTTT